MKKLWIMLFLLLSLACLFVACDEDDIPTVCQHRDADDDSFCDKCGESYTDGVDIAPPVHTHTWGEWSITVTPTCTTEGSHRRVCSGCPASEIEVIPAAHTYDAENTCTRCLDYKDKGVVFVLENYICTVTDYTGNAPEVILPSKYMGSTVTSISSSVFENCSGLTSITIPSSVKSIGDRAFYGCTGLTSITIPNSVTSIGSSAFENCSGLTSITIPNSVTSIGRSAFSGCSGLTSITIPNSVKSIGDRAFYGCTGLTSITIPSSVKSIGDRAFYGCTGLASITIPNSVTSIGSSAFENCSGLTSITIPSSVTSIGDWAFDGCSGLTSITIPSSVTSIGDWVFDGCSGLTSINYRGTEAQWNAITKGYDWDYGTGNYTITYNYTGE